MIKLTISVYFQQFEDLKYQNFPGGVYPGHCVFGTCMAYHSNANSILLVKKCYKLLTLAVEIVF